jgi:hypothetical protein
VFVKIGGVRLLEFEQEAALAAGNNASTGEAKFRCAGTLGVIYDVPYIKLAP